jgi:hypothetical protein
MPTRPPLASDFPRAGHSQRIDQSNPPRSRLAARRSLRWARRSFAGVFLVGATEACCGGLPVGFVLAAAGAAGVAAGLGVAVLALCSAATVALLGRRRRRNACHADALGAWPEAMGGNANGSRAAERVRR